MSNDMPPIPATQLPPFPPFLDQVVSLHEAAHFAGVSPDTLRRCHKWNELTIIKMSPRRVGIRLSDLRAFIDARAAAPSQIGRPGAKLGGQ
jgi:hypothetical protein